MDILKNSVCRLCLQKHKKLVNIFDENDTQEQNDISRYIDTFFAVDIKQTDPHSTFVCKPCWDLIVLICKYRLQFRKNDSLLRSKEITLRPETTDSETIECHSSIKNILSKYDSIKLNIDVWNVNFDAKVDLSKSKIPDNLVIHTVKDNAVLRSGRILNAVSCKRKYEDEYRPPGFFDYNFDLKRSDRVPKKTKVFGNPFYYADDGEESDKDPFLSLMKGYSCESSKCPIILTITNIPQYLTIVHHQYHSLSSRQKRCSAQKARENLTKWLRPKKTSPFNEDNIFHDSSYELQDELKDEDSFTTIQCTEHTWNHFSNTIFQNLFINDQASKIIYKED